MWLFVAFVAVPIVEIALFIQVGGLIGLWPTLAIVVMTAMAGTWLVRSQGRLALSQLQGSFQRLDDPSEPLAHGAMILISGALLLTPGFFTDFVGFLLLIPQFRSAVFRYVAARVTVRHFEMGPGSSHGHGNAGPIIDGDFEEVRSDRDPSGMTSGWQNPDRH